MMSFDALIIFCYISFFLFYFFIRLCLVFPNYHSKLSLLRVLLNSLSLISILNIYIYSVKHFECPLKLTGCSQNFVTYQFHSLIQEFHSLTLFIDGIELLQCLSVGKTDRSVITSWRDPVRYPRVCST